MAEPFGLTVPGESSGPIASPVSTGSQSLGSAIVPMRSLADLQQMEKPAPFQPSSIADPLAAFLRRQWTPARDHKRDVETLMNAAQQARRGEYTADEKALIAEQGSPGIFMMLTATKARQAVALIRDVLVGTGSEKPWTIQPTPKPELPQDVTDGILLAAQTQVMQLVMAGVVVPVEQVREMLREAESIAANAVMEQAREEAEIAETKMEDQLVEGGFPEALAAFIDDLPSFKTAFLKGPVVRKKPQLTWTQGEDGKYTPVVEHRLIYEWERVSPYDIYPGPNATSVHDDYLFEHIRFTRSSLHALIGVDGYHEEPIRKVLDEYGRGGLREWTIEESERKPEHENRTSSLANDTTISGLQYWGSVQGKVLRDWGMSAEEVPDELAEYTIEAILIGSHVIRAVLNPDPLERRPYYADSYERVPGQFWGNCLWDLIRDCQSMCNAAARALAGNLGIASGPQVAVNTDRMPPGETITQMYPWKIWPTTSDPMGASTPPILFFQPDSHAEELMRVYERFSLLADEYSGLPRYMTGNEGTPGAGRTASGLSMMISNASKTIKQVVGSIDQRVIEPVLQRLYYYNMRYGEDRALQGDLKIVARGALSLVAKEAAQVRINEFLLATANPIDMQIIGLEGRAALLRESAKRLDINVDRVVPSTDELRRRALLAQLQAASQPPQDPQDGKPDGSGGGKSSAPKGNGQQLTNGAPVTDMFSPTPTA